MLKFNLINLQKIKKFITNSHIIARKEGISKIKFNLVEEQMYLV
jgi:hypothetical protein